MFCEKCGAKNSDEAVFCQKCAFRLIADEEQTRIATTTPRNLGSETEEKEIFTIRPTLMFVKVGYGAAVISAFMLVVILYYFGKLIGFDIPWWFSVLAGLSLLLIPAYQHLKRSIVRYTLTDSKIEISEGLISTHTRNVPLRTIQDVSVSASIFQRMLGFGNLIIDNASENGGKITLKNINSPKRYADTLLKQMRLLDK
jgi:membrane protein YdbS with pleckstrin-like domain